MRRCAAAALVVASLPGSGCIRYRAHPLDPVRSEQQYRARALTDPGLRAFLKRAGWPPAKLGFGDLAAVALYFNPDVDVARAQLRTARAAVITAKARPNPSLAVGGGYENSPESPLLFSFDPAFTVITAGKRGWRVLEAEKLAEAARVAVEETAWHVRSRVRAAWLEHLMALRSLEVLRNEAGARAQSVAMLEARLKAGEASRPDVDIVRAALTSVEVAAKAAETRVGETRAALAAAVGLPVLPALEIETAPLTPSPLSLDDVQRAGLLHRADIRRGLLEYAAADAGLHLEIANQYPDLQYTPGYSFDEGHHKFTLTPAFNVPVFNRNRGPIAEAEARRGEAEARFNALQAQAIGEMQFALASYNGALAELAEAERKLVRIQQMREGAARRAVQAGEEDRLNLAGVQAEAAVAVQARFEALRRVEAALGSLEDAVQQPLEPGPALPDPAAIP